MKKYKIVIFVLMFFVLFTIGTMTARADTGPKPSIQITFEHLEGEYYATLLSKNRSTGPSSAFDDENINLEEVHEFKNSGMSEEQYRKFITYQDSDGYYFLRVTWKLSAEKNTLKWGYYPPSDFKILLYSPQFDTFACSEKMECYAFDSYFLVDMENFNITGATMLPKAKNNYDYFGEILALIVRMLITIAVEMLLALALIGKKKILVSIVIVNVITQLILNIILNVVHYNSGTISYILAYFGLEMLIIIIEAIVYGILFKKSKNPIDRPILRGFAYSIVANIASFGMGIVLVYYLPFAF